MEASLACWIIHLVDLKPGLRPIGVGGILKHITGTAAVSSTRNDVFGSVESFQVSAGHEAGCEALIHAINNNF